jgi:hypothetical protein
VLISIVIPVLINLFLIASFIAAIPSQFACLKVRSHGAILSYNIHIYNLSFLTFIINFNITIIVNVYMFWAAILGPKLNLNTNIYNLHWVPELILYGAVNRNRFFYILVLNFQYINFLFILHTLYYP